MGFPKGTVLGKHKRDAEGRLLNKDGSLYDLKPNSGQFKPGERNGREYRFQKGLVPHNKGKRVEDYVPEYSIKKMQKTQFPKGNLGPKTSPEGTVSRLERTRNGRKEVEYTINIDWRGKRKPHNSYKWYLWEVENQEDRPKGMILAVKNGNPDDIRLENLEVISRAENLERNRWS